MMIISSDTCFVFWPLIKDHGAPIQDEKFTFFSGNFLIKKKIFKSRHPRAKLPRLRVGGEAMVENEIKIEMLILFPGSRDDFFSEEGKL